MSDWRRRQLTRRPDRQAAARAEERRQGISYPIVRRCECLVYLLAALAGDGDILECCFCHYGSPYPTGWDGLQRVRFVRLATEGGRTYGKAEEDHYPLLGVGEVRFSLDSKSPGALAAPVYATESGEVTFDNGPNFLGYAVSSSSADGTVTVRLGGSL